MPTKPTGRPRGRPKGSKNTPKLEAFIAESLAIEIPAPLPPPPPKQRVRGPWANKTPEERSAYARAIRANRDPSTYNTAGRKPGIPSNMSAAQYHALVASQKPIVARIMKKMSDTGQLPEDPRAVEALEQTVMVLRTAQAPRDKLGAARLLLDFLKAKPTTKIETTVRTAEDILDEMAED
jgi:hypothetical protein